MVEMELNEKTWFTVRETPGVGDFVGAHGTPTKMTEAEVNQMLGQEDGEDRRRPQVRIDVERGDRVKIKDGPFENFEGTVEEVIEARGPGQGHADHLQPAHAGRPRVLASGTNLIRKDRGPGDRRGGMDGATSSQPSTASMRPRTSDDGQGDDGEGEAPVPRRAGDPRPSGRARRWASTESTSVSS